MAGTLDTVRAKVTWARKRMDELNAAVEASGYHSELVTFEQTFDATSNRIDVTIATVPQTDPQWSLMAADAIQNLRTALNYLVWELAKWNLQQKGLEREPKKITQFPIATKEADFRADFVQDLHPNHVAIIKFLQPFGPPSLAPYTDKFLAHFSEPGVGHPLVLLARLSNTDKHRVLQAAVTGGAESKLGPYVGIDCVIQHTSITPNFFPKPGSPWVSFDVLVTGPAPQVQIPDTVRTAVALEGGGLVGAAFEAMESKVLQLIDFFEPVFQPDEAMATRERRSKE